MGRFIAKIAPHRWRCPECGCSLTVGAELVPLHSRLTKQAEAEALGLYKARRTPAPINHCLGNELLAQKLRNFD